MAVSYTLTGTTQSVTATNGSPNVTVANTTGWAVGATVQGTGWAAGTKIVSFVPNTSAVFSNNFTGTTGATNIIVSSNTGTLTIALAASGDTANPNGIIAAGIGALIGNKTIQIYGATKIVLNIATGAVWDDTEWVYELGNGSSLRMNESYGCGIWRSGWILVGSTYIKAKGHTVNYNNYDNSTGVGGRTIFFNSGAPAGYVAGTTMPSVHWNDIGWYEAGGSNAAAIPSMYYGSWSPVGLTSGRMAFDYSGDSAGANSGFGGSYGTIESVLLYRCIGGIGTGVTATSLVTINKLEYFSLTTSGGGTNPDIKMAFPNNLPFSGFAPIFWLSPASNEFLGCNTTANEILVDYILPTGFNVLTNSRNYSNGTRTYRRTVSFPIKDSTGASLTSATLYITSGANTLINAVQAGDFSQALDAAYCTWATRSPASGSYIAPISTTDTRSQTAQFRKNGYVSQSVTYSLQDSAYSQPIFMLSDPAYGSVTPAQAAALTGLSLDYTNKVYTVSTAHNLDEVYAFGQYSQALTANSAQADFQTSTGGKYKLTSPWKMSVTAGALTMGSYNNTFNSQTAWTFGNTASLNMDKDDVVWTPAARADLFQFQSGSTFNITNGSTLTVSPTAGLGYGTATTSEFRSGSTLNMSDSAVTYNIVSGGAGTVFSNSEAGATWNISNSTLTLNCPNNAQVAVHAYFLPASVINGLTINGTASNVVWQMGYTTNNSKMVGFKYGGAIFGNGTSNVLMDTYTYTGALTTIPNTFGSSNKWWWVDPTMQAGGLFRWAAGSTPTGNSGFYGVIGFRPTFNIDKTGFTPSMRIKPSALSSRYPAKIFATTAFSTVDRSNFYRDPTFMASTDGFLPFVDGLDDKTVLNTIDWTVTTRQAGWQDLTQTFTASTAKTGLITATFSGVVDAYYVNATTGFADSALITVNTSTKTIAPVSGTLTWSPQRLYNALKNWWATYASDTDFLSSTSGSTLNLGDYNVDANISFTTGNSNDVLTTVRTTGLINAATNAIPVTDSRGTSTIWQFQSITVGTSLAIWDATGTTKYFQGEVTSAGTYSLYITGGTTGTYYYAIEKYGYKREEGNFPANSGGVLFYVPSYVQDVGITQTTQATVAAYTTVDTLAKLYDYTAYKRLSEVFIKAGQLTTRDGTAVNIGLMSLVVNTSAASVEALSGGSYTSGVYSGGTITIKANTLAAGGSYLTIIATPPKTVTANTTETITCAIEDANGDSQVTIQGGSGNFTLWKITNATPESDYATGTNLGNVGNITFRFIHADGYKIVIVDNVTGYRIPVSMSKGVYTKGLFFGDQVQLAQSAEVTQINSKVDILQTEVGNIMDSFNITTDSLHAIRGAVDGVPAAVLASTVETGATVVQSLRLHNAVLGGKVSGAGSGVEKFRDLADTKDRLVSTVDNLGNRSSEVADLT